MKTISQWGIQPEIDKIAKAAHDAFWRSISINGVDLSFEDRSENFKRAWQEAALAVIKAVTTIDY